MPFVNKFKILVCTACLVLVGQGFAAADCLETATVWNKCVSTPGDTTINEVTYKKITTEKELAWLSNNRDNNAILLNDLDMGGKLWVPIAAGKGGSVEYKMIFDGNNHVVKNLYINGSELYSIKKEYAQNLGFIAVLGGGTIKNLILEDVDIHASTNAGAVDGMTTDNQISVGSFVGWMSEKGASKVEGCMATGTIKTTGNGQGVGGIVGNAKKGTISNCMSLVEIQTSGSDAYIGGIIGITKTDVTVSSCVYAGPGLTNTGANGLVGGIAGNVFTGKLTTVDNYFEGENIDGIGGSICKSSKTPTECTEDAAKKAAASIANAHTQNVDITNAENVACALNGKNEDGSCKAEPWAVGETGLSLNGYGKDGYKIIFNAKGGSFADGTVSKNVFLQKGMTISAAEIVQPTHADSAFAGWSLDSNATEPAADLGSVSGTTKVYAVWYPIFTVTFSAAPGSFKDGETTKTIQITKNERITVENIELPFSYKNIEGFNFYFTGWALTENAPEKDTLSVLPNATENTTLYAVWTQAITYTVTYNDNGHGKTKVDFVRVEKRQKTQAPADPEPDAGYEFDSWYKEPACVNKFDFDDTEIEENWILYAKWTLEPYSISYVMNGHSSQGDNRTSYDIETETFSLIPPADVDGYDFEGWFKDASFTDKATQVIQGTAGDKTFYAKWSKKTYKVMYLADNDSYGSISDMFVEHGSTINLESAGIFRRAGYEQSGWSTTMAGAKDYELGEEITVTAPVTLYPTWEIIPYTISYTCSLCDISDESVYPRSYNVESSFGLPFPTVEDGYSFVGWYKDSKYKNKVVNVQVGSTGNLKLYGKVLEQYIITYVGADDSYGDKTYTIESGAQLRTAAPRAGYIFGGWFTNAEFEGDAVTQILAGASGDTTFYAKWVPVPYTITYNIDGEPAELTPNTYSAAEATELATPTRDGYEFDGWYTNAEFNGDKVASIDAGSIGDTTFYAKWTAVEYTATYDVNGGSMDGDVSFTFTIESGELTLATPNAREGFTFDGWLDSKTGSVLTGTFPANSFGERTLIAQWTPVLSTITVTAKSQVFEYDGKAHSAECEVTTENPWGYTFTASSDEQVTDVKDDEVTANCSVVVKDGDEDITALFDGSIEYVPGTISVKAKVVNYGGIAVTTDEDGTTAEIDDEAKLQIDIPSDVTVDHVTFNRNFPLVKYSTVVLPFSIDTNKVHGADFYSVSMLKQNGKWVAGASEVKTSQLIANTPYLLFAREANLTFDGPVTFNTSEMHDSTTIHEAEGCSWTFKGTYTKHVWGEGDPELGKVYAFSAHDVSDDIKIGKFTKFGKDAWIRPMRAYLIYESLPSSDPEPNHAPAPMSASAFKSMSSMASIENSDVPEWIDVVIIGNEDEQTTPIARLNTQTGEVKMMNGWFDMKGRKLNGKPTVKGIYYNNGKRVIVK